jgi:hypothetical protein
VYQVVYKVCVYGLLGHKRLTVPPLMAAYIDQTKCEHAHVYIHDSSSCYDILG